MWIVLTDADEVFGPFASEKVAGDWLTSDSATGFTDSLTLPTSRILEVLSPHPVLVRK